MLCIQVTPDDLALTVVIEAGEHPDGDDENTTSSAASAAVSLSKKHVLRCLHVYLINC